jgi:hypothetical protein
MAEFLYQDYEDGCHNLIVTCRDRDEMIRLKNWCEQQIGPQRVMVNDLFESAGVLKLAVTFEALGDAQAFQAAHGGADPEAPAAARLGLRG